MLSCQALIKEHIIQESCKKWGGSPNGTNQTWVNISLQRETESQNNKTLVCQVD